MKIAVYGATGAVGSRIVAEADRRGHPITGYARKAGRTPEGVVVAAADASDPHDVAKIAREHDVVVSALGPTRAPGGDPNGYAEIIAGMAHAIGTGTRLAVVGGAGSLLTQAGVRLVDTPDFPASYRPEALAHCAALDILRRTDPSVDWFYLSPAPLFAPGTRTGTYRLGNDTVISNELSYEDYAAAFVDELETPTHIRQRFAVAGGSA